MRLAPAIILSDEERMLLERWARGRSTPARLVLRARIILLAAAGLLNKEIASQLPCGAKTVCLWRSRFANLRISGIEKDAKRGVRRSTETDALVRRIVHTTLHESPPRGARWSTRSLASALGTSPAMVQRVWKQQGLTAHSRPAIGNKSPTA